ncbi:hypothetical protein P171DRAFT_481111 [Karstenula rhodostoma CBS 690.94]|uniref:Peptidase S54 rhomboid domain-containing protein n=1 Tax=Karstenula rhodostoma CBS 690.94 TaxID=1392251 RepID=A0A9P4UGY0_9PLEO|nr:hypothetical protein P171DRAFT_481111 [Karstenula rhodostoma CBS 690.94]
MWWIIAAAGAGFAWSVKDTPPQPSPSIALRKPGLWALGASTTAYVGLAAMQGFHDRCTDGSYSRSLKKKKEEYILRRSSPLVSHRGLSLTMVGLNLAVFMHCQSAPRKLWRLADSPSGTWTLLTCAFCHKDIQHLSANMASLVPEIPHMLQVCGQSPYQFIAFYVSAAIFSSYAQRAVSYIRWTQRWTSRFGVGTPLSMGASGVAMAVFAASCFAQPSWASPSFLLSTLTLGWQVTNDLNGLFYSDEAIGFAAHLAGAAFGAMYAYFNADCYIWSKLVRLFSGIRSGRNLPKPPTQTIHHDNLDLNEIVRRLNESA